MNYKYLDQDNSTPKVALKELIEQIDIRAGSIDSIEVEGVNINKAFAPTVANLKTTDLSKYKHVPHLAFAANLMHVGRDAKLPVAINTTSHTKFVSPAYFVFRVKDQTKFSPKFLDLLFKTNSFDRRCWFSTDNSIRGNLTWEDLTRIIIPLPPIAVQQSYVDIYSGLIELINQNESLITSLEETAQAYIAKCRKQWPLCRIGNFIHPFSRKNTDNLDLPFMGLNKDKQIIPTSANTTNIDKQKYNILKKGELAFSGMQTGRDICIRIALSEIQEDILLSPAYTTFRIKNTNKILAEYFFLNFKSPEMDRLGWFKSDSSVRSNLDWERFCEIEIPLPPIKVQKAIVALYHCAEEARKIAAEAKAQLAVVCPAMIQRATQHS